MATVLEGLRFGFKLGFSPSQSLKPAKRNKPSAYEHPSVINEYLATEVSLGRVTGPFASPPVPLLHVSSFGVIPKKGQRGKWRLIVDLSSPGGASVNDGINPDEFTLHNTTVDQFIRMVSQFGQGALMAKFDVEAAYRNIAIHPSDRFLLGMKWRSKIHVDLALPFRLRSAPYIFNCVAELVEWILVNNYKVPNFLHYLDDFITAGPPDSPQCAQNLSTVLLVCDRLGLPLHPGKCVCGMARQNIPPPYDRPLKLFPQEGSSHSVKQRIPPRPAVVGSSLISVAWRQFLVVPRTVSRG